MPEYRRRYGLDFDSYVLLFQHQGGRCAICQRDDRLLVLDHNHSTGRVRGLLCANCNAGIGMLSDNPSVLLRAASYVARHPIKTAKQYKAERADRIRSALTPTR